MKIAKKINTILCDDVRQEIGGKMSLMGIYSKDMVVNKVPAILPFINLIVMFEDIKEPFDNIFVSVITPESEPMQVTYLPPPGLEKGKDVNIIIGLSPFRLNATGPAKFEIRLSKNEKPRIVHRFSIKTSD